MNENILNVSTESLEKIGAGNSDAISALVELIRNNSCVDGISRRRAAKSLVKIGAGNSDVIGALFDLTRNSKNVEIRREAVESFRELLLATLIPSAL
jgi:HEAT repeat protein